MSVTCSFTLNLKEHRGIRRKVGVAIVYTIAFFTRRVWVPRWMLWTFFYQRPAWAKRR